MTTKKEWWQGGSWLDKAALEKLRAFSTVTTIKAGEEDPGPLLRQFNPDCVGKHDRTSYDIMICDSCLIYTTMVEGNRKRDKANLIRYEQSLIERKSPLIPDRFQSKEEGPWHNWISGNVDPSILKLKANPDNKNIYINGCLVVALAFPTAHGVESEKKRIWRCDTGWQKPGML